MWYEWRDEEEISYEMSIIRWAGNIMFFFQTLITMYVGTDIYTPVVYRILRRSSMSAFHENDLKFQKLDQKKNISNFLDH